ncbi:hypothetical protein [Amycolatopsis pigmentata]|uniref:Uncharacterized protein n=1 Tax=Amycolatopsis pigmentata TaxID=450801 RepID=A0ABW5G7R4_9PSEU
MNTQDEQAQAAEALAAVRRHQERARQAAQVPWWAYVAMFVLIAGVTAINDFVDLTGAKVLSAVVLFLLIVVVVTTFFTRTSTPLSKIRGVEARQSFVPWVFGVVAVVGGAGGVLLARYGTGLADDIAGAVGLRDYPNTVTGVLFGAAGTALFALGRLLLAISQRGSDS